jgi:hypothetical protein
MNEKIRKYKGIEQDSGYRFRFSNIDHISGPLVVGDNRYELWFIGGEEKICISQENEKICGIIGRMIKIHTSGKKDADEIINDILSRKNEDKEN